MKRSIITFSLMFVLLLQPELYAEENKTLGMGAVEGESRAMEWSTFIATTALIGTIFGLIFELSGSDPALFTHTHCHDCGNQ